MTHNFVYIGEGIYGEKDKPFAYRFVCSNPSCELYLEIDACGILRTDVFDQALQDLKKQSERTSCPYEMGK